jgi:carboxymethylenebutenolidase
VLWLLTSSLPSFVSGKVVVKLASSTDIQAAVVLHPGRITEDEIIGKFSLVKLMLNICSDRILSEMLRFTVSDVKVPIAILGAEIDHTSPPEQLKEFEKKLSEKSEVRPKKIHP